MTKKQKNKQKGTPGLLAYHIAASLISIAPHPQSGRSMHSRHTSHGILILALVLTGVLLFSNLGTLRAYGVSQGGSHVITVNVSGNPPTIGADITYPTNNSITKSAQIEVKGTCQASTLVATFDNGGFAGSSMCTNGGNYATTIQLTVGINTLQSQNYDGLNQPGPVTAQVAITRQQDPVVAPGPVDPTNLSTPPQIATAPGDISPNPTPSVVNPAPQPSLNPCYEKPKEAAAISQTLTIFISCINRTVFAGETLDLPVIISGGLSAYALSIDWGDGVTDLKSVADAQYHSYQHIYKSAGGVGVKLKVTDSKGSTSFIQAVVAVNGSPVQSESTSSFANITGGFSSIWTEAPVPMYWAAVTLMAGFWIGDIFHRYFSYRTLKGAKAFQRNRRV